MMYRFALACALWLLLASRAGAAELVVVIRGLESNAGELQIEVYGEAQRATFPYAERGVTADLRVSAKALAQPGKQASVSLGDLAPGRYAVSVIHDANGNGDIDLNLLGMPLEAYGFSNGVRPTLHAPSFDDAAFAVAPEGVTRVEVTLSH
jgi:uncharacterized protein (DUF2141 family)